MSKASGLGPLNGSIIVGYDFTNGKDKSVLVVGVKEWNESVTIINAFQGAEAEELFKKLTEKKENTNALPNM